jgi:predicted nucleic acid-binding protein
MIAAITQSRGATLATRNSKDFNNCGIDLINPWDACGN